MVAEAEASLLQTLGLSEYQSKALAALLIHGRATAPHLTEATDIPKARIYGVLEELANDGYIKIIPGRPKEYQAKPPATVLDRAIENQRQTFEDARAEIETIQDEVLSVFGPRYERASKDISPTEELFYVIDVGKPSESETRAIYQETTGRLAILTKSFEYFDAVENALSGAIDRGVAVSMLFVHPRHLSPENRSIQQSIAQRLDDAYPSVETRYSEHPLPWRGTISDPSMEYDKGKAIFLVEEKNVPLHLRQAAVTENGSFVAGMMRYFELIWENESVPSPSTADD